MKKLLIYFSALLIFMFTSCMNQKKSTSSSKKTDNSKESLEDLLYGEHVKGEELNAEFISGLQMYSSKKFTLNATGSYKNKSNEGGALKIEEKPVERIINFPDKIEGKIISVNKNLSSVLVQFHNGSDGKIGPPIWFHSNGEKYFISPSQNSKGITSNGIVYTPNSWDVYLKFKLIRNTNPEKDEFTVSGVDVNGSSGTSTNPSNGNEFIDSPTNRGEIIDTQPPPQQAQPAQTPPPNNSKKWGPR